MSGVQHFYRTISSYQRMRAYKACKIPAPRHRTFKFSKSKKISSILKNEQSVISTTTISKLIMVWSIMSVKHGSYAVLMENRCKMAIKHRFLNMNGSSLHFFKNKKYDVQKISYHLNLFPQWRLDPFLLKNQCLLTFYTYFPLKLRRSHV
jgi:hypothetical protein